MVNKLLKAGIIFLMTILLTNLPIFFIYNVYGQRENITMKDDNEKIDNIVKIIDGYPNLLHPGDIIFCEIWDYLP